MRVVDKFVSVDDDARGKILAWLSLPAMERK